MVKLIEKNAMGVYNVGTDKKTMYELALKTKSDVKPSDIFNNDRMPTNTTMNINKMKKFLK
jgi:hypothetical protein